MIATEQVQQQRQKPILTAGLWAIVYPFGVLHFLLGWIGWQQLSPEWYGEPLLLYILVGILGTLGSFALLFKSKRWGVYGLIGTWVATALLNVISSRPLRPDAIVQGSLLIIVFLLEVRGSWRFLE